MTAEVRKMPNVQGRPDRWRAECPVCKMAMQSHRHAGGARIDANNHDKEEHS